MIRIQMDRAGLQRLRQWTIGVAFVGACIWVAGDAIERMNSDVQAEQPVESIQDARPTSAAEWMSWGVQQALEGEYGSAGMRPDTSGLGGRGAGQGVYGIRGNTLTGGT